MAHTPALISEVLTLSADRGRAECYCETDTQACTLRPTAQKQLIYYSKQQRFSNYQQTTKTSLFISNRAGPPLRGSSAIMLPCTLCPERK